MLAAENTVASMSGMFACPHFRGNFRAPSTHSVLRINSNSEFGRLRFVVIMPAVAAGVDHDPSEAVILPKFAYAYKHYCLPVWLNDRRSQRRIGIVNGGMTCTDCVSTGCTSKRFVGFIGTSRSSARHQSPHLTVGNLGVHFALEDVVAGKELNTGDVVVYDLAWIEGPTRADKSIRYATNVVLVEDTAKYTGDPMEVDTFATMSDSRIPVETRSNGRRVVKRQQAHYVGERSAEQFWNIDLSTDIMQLFSRSLQNLRSDEEHLIAQGGDLEDVEEVSAYGDEFDYE